MSDKKQTISTDLRFSILGAIVSLTLAIWMLTEGEVDAATFSFVAFAFSLLSFYLEVTE